MLVQGTEGEGKKGHRGEGDSIHGEVRRVLGEPKEVPIFKAIESGASAGVCSGATATCCSCPPGPGAKALSINASKL